MDFDVLAYGANGDGKTDDSIYIQRAIDDAYQYGGGRVVLDGAKVYYSSSITLRPNVELHIALGSVLKASGNIEDYLHPNKGEKDKGVDISGTPVTLKPSYAFIYGYEAHGAVISGRGVIDGNCYAFVKRVSEYYVTGDFYPRPTMIYIEASNHITIKDITLRNAPFWTLHPAGCNDVLISSIRILNPLDVANSDGIDPDHSSNVRILGCHIECADDCICLKSSKGNMEYGPTENILISDCTLISTSAALKIGTEGTGDFRNVIVRSVCISKSNRGISIQIRDGGNVENVIFSDIMIETRRFSPSFWGSAEPISISSVDRDENTQSGTIRNIRFENITARGENGVFIFGNGKVSDVTFRSVRIMLEGTSKWEKGVHDYRPGVGTEILKDGTYGFFSKGAENVKFEDCCVVWLNDVDGTRKDDFYTE